MDLLQESQTKLLDSGQPSMTQLKWNLLGKCSLYFMGFKLFFIKNWWKLNCYCTIGQGAIGSFE